MKKTFLILFSFILLFLTGCKNKVDLTKIINSVSIPEEIVDIKENITLPTVFEEGIIATWESNIPTVIDNTGVIYPFEEDQLVALTLTLTYKGKTTSKTFDVFLYTPDYHSDLEALATELTLPTKTSENLNLPTTIGFARITWTSTANNILSRDGVVGVILNPTTVTLMANLKFSNASVTKAFTIDVLPPDDDKKLEIALNSISFPETLNSSVLLPTNFLYNVTATWQSSDENILSNKGYVFMQEEEKEVNLTVTLKTQGDLTMTHTFNLNISKLPDGVEQFNGHLYKKISKNFNGEFDDVKIENEKLVLSDTALTGTYTSKIIQTLNFSELIGSWGALTSEENENKGTCELQIRVRVDDTWSEYLTYGAWGLHLQNAYLDQDKPIAKMAVDEIKVQNDKTANAFQYKLILKRKYLSDAYPVASFVTAALKIPDYTFEVDESVISGFKDYEVPKLNQNIVPTIGNSICSPTSATMLLKYKGHSFAHMDTYEHRYIAGLSRDYGHQIYGNWVYNCVTMSSFGEISYVKRLYSFEELFHHLETVGPISTTVRGNMVEANYNTSGHLLVVRGYKITDNGTFIICNDPNVSDVHIEYSLTTFSVVWSKIIYVIE